eukprot:Colp12_sorted_trinity150504_noHs@7539
MQSLAQIDRYNEERKAQIAVTQRATRKAEQNVSSMEVEKKKQDFLVDQLQETVRSLTEKISMYDAQYLAQCKETEEAKKTLMEANTEMEALLFEKKQLYSQWKSSLVGMSRRDEANAAMQAALL